MHVKCHKCIKTTIMKIPYSLIAKYIAKETNSEENDQIEEWLSFSSERLEIFQDFKKYWEIDSTEKEQVYPDKEGLWNSITDNISINKPKHIKFSVKNLFNANIRSMVASIAVIVGITITYSVLFNTNDQKAIVQTTFIAPKGQKSEVILADGTHVWLNSGSKLTYNSDFLSTNRSVKIEGEAFFEVTKNPKSKFVVTAGEIDVVVYGTEFNVRSFDKDTNIVVSLLNGHVTVNSHQTQNLIADLKPNMEVQVNKKTLTGEITSCDAENESVWRLGKLIIKNNTLGEIAEKMERWYGVNINLNNVDTTERYWMTIKTESLDETLKLINKITPIKYTVNGEEVTIGKN